MPKSHLYGPLGPVTFIFMLTYKFLSHSINIQFLPIMGPTSHQANLAYSGQYGQITTQVHGIACGSQATYWSPPYECSRTRKTTVAKLLAFWHFGFCRYIMCVQCMYTPGKQACCGSLSHQPTTISPFN